MGGFGSGSGGKRHGAGRPPGSRGPKCVNMSIRVTVEERAAMRERATVAGFKSVTEYILMRTLAGVS